MNNRDQHIVISIAEQSLSLIKRGVVEKSYRVSTAKNGPGEQFGSGCTPRGKHIVRAKIGAGLGLGSVLVGRRFTTEIYSDELATDNPERDWILSRVLWLSGTEAGVNRGGQVDTMRRYIYIHGSPDDSITGVALSHGCIRMHNSDVMELFDLIEVGIAVLIETQTQ